MDRTIRNYRKSSAVNYQQLKIKIGRKIKYIYQSPKSFYQTLKIKKMEER